MNTSNNPAGPTGGTLDFLEIESAFAAGASTLGAGALQVMREQIDRIRALHAQDDQLDPQRLQKLAGVRATEAAALVQMLAELETLQAGIGPSGYGWDTLAQAELERSMWTRAKRRTTPQPDMTAAFAERSRTNESVDAACRRIFQQVATGGRHGC